MLSRLLSLLVAAASLALADLAIVKPSGGTLQNTGIVVQLSGADAMNVQIQVIVGGNTDALSTVIYSNPATKGSDPITVVVPAATGPPATFAAYYLRVIGTPAAGGPASTIYSSRFQLSGMSGDTTAFAAKLAAAQAAGTTVPTNQLGAAAQAGAGAGAAAPPGGSIPPFSLQTGLIKYAPMQLKPGTQITAVNTAPLYPTSAWSLFLSAAPIAVQTSTVTPSASYSAQSRENTAAPAPQPTGDMAKFLARWID